MIFQIRNIYPAQFTWLDNFPVSANIYVIQVHEKMITMMFLTVTGYETKLTTSVSIKYITIKSFLDCFFHDFGHRTAERFDDTDLWRGNAFF